MARPVSHRSAQGVRSTPSPPNSRVVPKSAGGLLRLLSVGATPTPVSRRGTCPMSLMSRIRLVDRKAVPDFTGRPRVRVPGWLLLPGLIALFVSTALLVLVHHTYHYAGSDLNMYRSSALALRNGEQLYARFFDGLPFTSPPITAIFMRPTTYVTLEHANEAMLVIAVVATVVA